MDAQGTVEVREPIPFPTQHDAGTEPPEPPSTLSTQIAGTAREAVIHLGIAAKGFDDGAMPLDVATDIVANHFKGLALDVVSEMPQPNSAEIEMLKVENAGLRLKEAGLVRVNDILQARLRKFKAAIVPFTDFWEDVRDHFYEENNSEMDGQRFEEIAEEAGLLEVADFERKLHGALPQTEGLSEGDSFFIETEASQFHDAV
jgi:hypothetical protein